jgi:large subunit ribosomal protein L15
MPLYRRLAQRGFSNYPFKKVFQVVNLAQIDKSYEEGETVDPGSLIRKGLAKGTAPVKILANGALTKRLVVKIGALSASAREKIERAGGTVMGPAAAGKSVGA